MIPAPSHSAPSAKTVELIQTGQLPFENQGAGVWVDVMPHPEAKPSFCDDNVAAQIRDHGGAPLSVWDVTESGPFVEIEAHVIWRASDGRLLDVSPSLIGASKHFVIPALEPFTRPFPGNVLLALTEDAKTHEIAYYFSMANAVIAPNRVVGQMNIRPRVLQSWAEEYVKRTEVNCDMEKLMRACFVALISRGAVVS